MNKNIMLSNKLSISLELCKHGLQLHLNNGKVLAVLQSFSNEFQIIAPQFAKLFRPYFVFNRGGHKVRNGFLKAIVNETNIG